MSAKPKVRVHKFSPSEVKFYEELDKAPAKTMPPEAPKMYRILLRDLASKYRAKESVSVGRRLKRSTIPGLYKASYHTGLSFKPPSPELTAEAEQFLRDKGGVRTFDVSGVTWQWKLTSVRAHKHGGLTVLSTVEPLAGHAAASSNKRKAIARTTSRTRKVGARATKKRTVK